MEVYKCYCTCDRCDRTASHSCCLVAQQQKVMMTRFAKNWDNGEHIQSVWFPDLRLVHIWSPFNDHIRKFVNSNPLFCFAANGLESVLSPILEDLSTSFLWNKVSSTPPPNNLHIWKQFASPQVQRRWRGFCTGVAYYPIQLRVTPSAKFSVIKTLEKHFLCWMLSFADAHLELKRQKPGEELKLRSILTNLASEAASFFQLLMKDMKEMEQLQSDWHSTEFIHESHERASLMRICHKRDELLQSLSKVTSLASEIADQISLMESPEVPSEDSWSLISDARQTCPDAIEVGSVASCHSADSQMSYLSGHGAGPNCFLPYYLFKVLGEEVSSASPAASLVLAHSLVRAQDVKCNINQE